MPPQWKTGCMRSLQQGGLLVLTVHPRIARRAEAELLHRFGAAGHSARAAAARELRRAAAERLARAGDSGPGRLERRAEADAADRGSRHWINLQRLVQRTLPTLRPRCCKARRRSCWSAPACWPATT